MIIKRCEQYFYKVPQCQNLLFLLLYVFERNQMAIIATNVKAKMLQPFNIVHVHTCNVSIYKQCTF